MKIFRVYFIRFTNGHNFKIRVHSDDGQGLARFWFNNDYRDRVYREYRTYISYIKPPTHVIKTFFPFTNRAPSRLRARRLTSSP